MAGLPLALPDLSPRTGGRAAALPRRRRQPLPLPRVVMCDLDGTLIDTMPILADLATVVMNEIYAMPAPLARELYLATCGLPFIQQLEKIFPGDERNAGASDLFEGRKP